MFSFSTGTAPGEGVGSRTLYGIAFGPLTVPEAEQQTDHSRNKGGDHAETRKTSVSFIALIFLWLE